MWQRARVSSSVRRLLCRDSSCAARTPPLLHVHLLWCGHTSCTAGIPLVLRVYLLCCGYTSCAAGTPPVLQVYLLCCGYTSCAADTHLLCCGHTSCTAGTPPVLRVYLHTFICVQQVARHIIFTSGGVRLASVGSACIHLLRWVHSLAIICRSAGFCSLCRLCSSRS